MIFVTNLKEWYRLPTNKKEGIIFTTMMCFLMVLGMSAYNLWLHQDLHLSSLLIGLVPGFVVAFILDVFIIGVLAKNYLPLKLPVNPEKQDPNDLNYFLLDGFRNGHMYVFVWCDHGTRNT